MYVTGLVSTFTTTAKQLEGMEDEVSLIAHILHSWPEFTSLLNSIATAAANTPFQGRSFPNIIKELHSLISTPQLKKKSTNTHPPRLSKCSRIFFTGRKSTAFGAPNLISCCEPHSAAGGAKSPPFSVACLLSLARKPSCSTAHSQARFFSGSAFLPSCKRKRAAANSATSNVAGRAHTSFFSKQHGRKGRVTNGIPPCNTSSRPS